LWQRRRWIEQVRRGDADAWAQLVRDHHGRIYAMLARLTRDRHAAEDLCQETFAAAWSGIGGFAGDCAIGTWLYRIAYRKFLDARRSVRSATANARSLSDDVSAVVLDPAANLAVEEHRRAIDEALARMDEAERVAVVLHYLQGLNYREMADVTGEPVGTMKWRTKVALEQLAGLLGAKNDHEQTRNARTDPTAADDAVAADSAGA